MTGGQRRALAAAVCIAAIACGLGLALAQGSPFGVSRPPGAAAPAPPLAASGFAGWLLAKQAEFYRTLSGLIRAAKADGSAAWALLGFSFLYGIFHAAGPGHGKAVISSYLVANDETWRRGVVLSFASAFLQAVAAVTLVGIAAVLFRATSATMCSAERVIEIASYALIALVGARLTWVKGRGFIAALRPSLHPRTPAPVGAAVTPPDHEARAQPHGAHGHHHHAHQHEGDDQNHDHHHDHHHHGHGHHAHDHAAGAAHVHDEHCGHAHGPEPEMLAGRGGWQRGLSAVFAVGLRPCSGAILVLVFALAQGLFWAGVASTFAMALGTALTVAAIATLTVGAKGLAVRLAGARSGGGAVAIRALEVLAAVAVTGFGLLLLAGYVVAERGTCL